MQSRLVLPEILLRGWTQLLFGKFLHAYKESHQVKHEKCYTFTSQQLVHSYQNAIALKNRFQFSRGGSPRGPCILISAG